MCVVFFFNDTATTEIYTLSLHDALPILSRFHFPVDPDLRTKWINAVPRKDWVPSKNSVLCEKHFLDSDFKTEREDKNKARKKSDRKSTRLNSSHTVISYAVFCLKKKKKKTPPTPTPPPRFPTHSVATLYNTYQFTHPVLVCINNITRSISQQ